MEEFGNASYQANDDMNKFAHVKASGILGNEGRRTNRTNIGYRRGKPFPSKIKKQERETQIPTAGRKNRQVMIMNIEPTFLELIFFSWSFLPVLCPDKF